MEYKKSTDKWIIEHPSGRGVVSSIPYCGYTKAQLASLRNAGYVLYKNGKIVKTGGYENDEK